MEDITYKVAMPGDDDLVRDLMHAFYSNDQNTNSISEQKITDTLHHLRTQHLTGSIILFEIKDKIIGYSLLINFWSN